MGSWNSNQGTTERSVQALVETNQPCGGVFNNKNSEFDTATVVQEIGFVPTNGISAYGIKITDKAFFKLRSHEHAFLLLGTTK